MTVPLSDPFGWTGATLAGVYRIEQVAAIGGFGIVYRAKHKIFGEPIAIKCLRLRGDANPSVRRDFYKMFLNEGRLLYRLSRDAEAVVQPLYLGAATSPRGAFTPYIALEWLRGESLASELEERRERRLPPWRVDEVTAIIEPVADALAMAHERGIVHRDLKPGNLFLREGFRRRSMKVLDFGVAKVMTHGAASTTTGAQAFTLRYAAPEQLMRDHGPTGPWTDVYSFALVLVEMLTGRVANDAEDLLGVARRTLDPAQRPTPRALGVDLGESLERVFAHALAVAPTNRPPHAGAFWSAFVDAARGAAPVISPAPYRAAPVTKTEPVPTR